MSWQQFVNTYGSLLSNQSVLIRDSMRLFAEQSKSKATPPLCTSVSDSWHPSVLNTRQLIKWTQVNAEQFVKNCILDKICSHTTSADWFRITIFLLDNFSRCQLLGNMDFAIPDSNPQTDWESKVDVTSIRGTCGIVRVIKVYMKDLVWEAMQME